MSFFRRRRAGEPRPAEAPRQPLSTNVRPPLASAEEALRVAVYSAGSVQRMGPGEAVVREGAEVQSVHILVEGAAVVTVGGEADGGAGRVALLRPGDCVGVLGGPTLAPYSVTTREACTWITLSQGAYDLLGPTEQVAVGRWIAATVLAQLGRTFVHQAGLWKDVRHLRGWIRDSERAVNQRVGAPAIRDALAGVPRLPVYASDILRKLVDERAHADEVVGAIRNDPALAALVLKTVNSAAYGLPQPVEDYYHALLHLGTIKVYQLVVARGLQSVIPTTVESEASLAHAQLIAMVMHEIARLSGTLRPEVATTIGLLHDVGRSVPGLVAPRHPDVIPLLVTINPAALGAALLRSWNLPEGVVEPVARQRDAELFPPEEIDPAHRDGVALLHVAHLCHDVLTTGDAATVSPAHAEAYLASLGLRERTAAELCQSRLAPVMARHARDLPVAIRQMLRVAAPDPA